MRLPHLSFVLAVGFAGVVGACSGSGPESPPPPSATGQWFGTAAGGGEVTMELTQDAAGAITGSGSFVIQGLDVSLSIEGVHIFPNVSITLVPDQGFVSINFDGVMDSEGAVISGTLSGSGATDPIDLHRQ